MKKFLLIFLGVIIAAFIIFYLVSSITYSEGSRTGYLTKFTKKGYVFKTYEGELNLGGMNAQNNSVVNYLWEFSVREYNTAVIDSLNNYEGKVIKLHYREVIHSFPWQGDTDYFIERVESAGK